MNIEFESTTAIRRIDDLGRIVIPLDLRKNAGIKAGDSFKVFVNKQGNICLEKVKESVGLKENDDKIEKRCANCKHYNRQNSMCKFLSLHYIKDFFVDENMFCNQWGVNSEC